MATRTKQQAVTPADRHVAVTNLGHSVAALVQEQSFGARSPELDYMLGQQIDKALRAAVKASVPGKQSTKQISALHDAARKAVNRALARMVTR